MMETASQTPTGVMDLETAWMDRMKWIVLVWVLFFFILINDLNSIQKVLKIVPS